MKTNTQIKGLIELIGLIIIFIFFSYLIQENIAYLESLIVNDVIGMIAYILLEISSIVIAPVTTFPLVTLASNLWGPQTTGILNMIGWTIGAWLAFIIGRKYGYGVVKKFISVKKLHEFENKIPEDKLFWSVVLLRVITPVDILSYALGIFTKMKTRNYLIATIIGIAPFAFIFAYIGVLDVEAQILIFLGALAVFAIGWIIKIHLKSNKRRKK